MLTGRKRNNNSGIRQRETEQGVQREGYKLSNGKTRPLELEHKVSISLLKEILRVEYGGENRLK